MRLRAVLCRHRIAMFLVITYAITWGAWLPLLMVGRVDAGFSPLFVLGLFGPAIGAVATLAISDGRNGLRGLRRRLGRVRAGLRYWVLGIGLPFGVYALTYLVLVAYSMFLLAPIALPTRASFAEVPGLPGTGLVRTVAWLCIVALGEEIGWRGFLQQTLQRRRLPLVASLLVAAAWAVWFAPALFIVTDLRVMVPSMIPLYLAALVGTSIFLGWLYHRGRRSILLVAACHAAFSLVMTAGGSIAVVEAIAVIAVGVWLALQELRESAAKRRATLRLLPLVSSLTERRTL